MASRNAIALTVTGRVAGHKHGRVDCTAHDFPFRGALQSNKARTLGKRGVTGAHTGAGTHPRGTLG